MSLRYIFLLFFFTQPTRGYSQLPQTSQGIRYDIDYFGDYLSSHHKNLFANISKEKFDSALLSLKKRADTLPAEKFLIELLTINALVADEHTRIDPVYTTAFPIIFDYFDEGIVPVETNWIYKDLLTNRLVSIDDHPASEIIEKLSGILKKDNPSFQKSGISTYINKPIILKGLGLINDIQKASFKVVSSRGDTIIKEIHASTSYGDADIIKAPPLNSLLAYTNNAFYWYSYDSISNTLYINYTRCMNDINLPFIKFNEQLFEEIEKRKPARLILDLRFNGGGSSNVLNPFIKSIKYSYLNTKGKFYVLIGRKTFSSALINAVTLVRQTKATTVGEPTGANINHYGELKSFVLPNSKFTVTYSTAYWKTWEGHTGALVPDIMVAHKLQNFLNNKDEAIDYVLKQ